MRRLLALIGLMTLFAAPAFAAAPDWTVDWGAVGRVRPAHFGSDSYRANTFTASIGVVLHWSTSPLRSRP